MKYPMHEKLKLIQDKSQAIGEFLDWVQDSRDYAFCCKKRMYENHHQEWMPMATFTDIIAEYFDIDMDILEDEKDQMLEGMRS